MALLGLGDRVTQMMRRFTGDHRAAPRSAHDHAHDRDHSREVPAPRAAYPGDFGGVPDLAYSPKPDGRPDPGEIVWTWVPYEENDGRGKDRPVLLVGHDGEWLLAVMLTSKDHDRDQAQESRQGRVWVDLGTGQWDHRGRPSEARVDRVIRVDPGAIRREGAVLDRARFEQVAAAITAAH